MTAQLNHLVVPVTPFQQNCSIVWCGETRQAAVIDPGGDLPLIRAAISEQGLAVERILITHGHLDHAGGAADLAAALGGVPIEGPQQEDAFWLAIIEEQGRQFGLPGCRCFTPDRWLGDGDRVSVGNVEFEVLHCPGHTPGHVVFFNRPAKTAFVGDVLFRGSVGRTDFPRGDFNALLAAIRGKLWPLGDDVRFVSGHGPDSTFGLERQTNPYCGDGVEPD